MDVVSSGKGAPVVSVALPVFNGERYLREAMDSILAQAYADFELLAFDDGSSDGSLAILREYERRDQRVRVFTRENRGLVATLNEMIDLARGKYFARMDSDDIALPNRFAVQIAYMDEHSDCVVLGSSVETINALGQSIAILRTKSTHRELDQLHLSGHTSICHPASMLRIDALKRVNGYDETMPDAEDLDLWLRLAEIGKLASTPAVLLQYRIHEGSVSESNRSSQHETMQRACEKAWQRRGINGSFDPDAVEWRPSRDRNSRHSFALKYGWQSWSHGNHSTWWTYAKLALALKPFSFDSWKLLVFGLLKSPKKGSK